MLAFTVQASGCATDVTEDNVEEGEVDKLVKGLVQQVSQVSRCVWSAIKTGSRQSSLKHVLPDAPVIWSAALHMTRSRVRGQWNTESLMGQTYAALLCAGWY